MLFGTRLKPPSNQLLTDLVTLGRSTLVMVLSTVPRSTFKFSTLSNVAINVVPFSATLIFLFVSIFSINAREQLRSRKKQQSIRIK